MRSILILVCVVLVVAAHAVEFVPADVRWTARLDVRALQVAGVLDAFQDPSAFPPQAAHLIKLEALTGLRLERDIDTVVVCGTDARPDNHLAIVQGRFDLAKLQDLAKTLPDYRAIPTGARTILEWTPPKWKRTVAACLVREDTLLMAGSADRLRLALATGVAGGAVPGRRSSPAVGSATAFDEWSGLTIGAKELAHVERANAHLAVSPTGVVLSASVHTGSWLRAEQLFLLARSGIAMIRLAAKLDPALITAISGATLTHTGPDIDVEVRLPMADARRVLLLTLERELMRVIAR